MNYTYASPEVGLILAMFWYNMRRLPIIKPTETKESFYLSRKVSRACKVTRFDQLICAQVNIKAPFLKQQQLMNYQMK